MDIFLEPHNLPRLKWEEIEAQWWDSAYNAGDSSWSLGQEDSLEKGMASHASIISWRIPWAEGPGGLQSKGVQRLKHWKL